jgi:hypothetical protein
MEIKVDTSHIEHQIYRGGITTRVDIDELVNGVKMTTYYADDKDKGLGVEEGFSIFIEKGKIIFQRKKLIPRYADDGSPWDEKGKMFEPTEIITNEVLKDYTVRPQ